MESLAVGDAIGVKVGRRALPKAKSARVAARKSSSSSRLIDDHAPIVLNTTTTITIRYYSWMLRLPTMSKSLSLPRYLSRRSTCLRTATTPLRRRQYATTTSHAPLERDPAELEQITTLPNGVRVATEALPGHFSGIGVYIDAGSRYENDALRGVSHIIDRLAFKSTTNRTADQMLESIETLGGNIQCASSRESLMYQSATFNSAVPEAIALLADTIRDPLVTEEEVERQLETADYEIGEIWGKPELILPELVHMAAYKDNTLGNPLLCPKERLESIDRKTVEAYRKAFFRPERVVVAFAGETSLY